MRTLIDDASREVAGVLLFTPIADKEGIRSASDAIAGRVLALVSTRVEELGHPDQCQSVWHTEACGYCDGERTADHLPCDCPIGQVLDMLNKTTEKEH